MPPAGPGKRSRDSAIRNPKSAIPPCPDCGGRLRLLATITERAAIEKILRHLGLPADLPNLAPARALPWLPGVPDHFDDGGSADREWPD